MSELLVGIQDVLAFLIKNKPYIYHYEEWWNAEELGNKCRSAVNIILLHYLEPVVQAINTISVVNSNWKSNGTLKLYNTVKQHMNDDLFMIWYQYMN